MRVLLEIQFIVLHLLSQTLSRTACFFLLLRFVFQLSLRSTRLFFFFFVWFLSCLRDPYWLCLNFTRRRPPPPPDLSSPPPTSYTSANSEAQAPTSTPAPAALKSNVNNNGADSVEDEDDGFFEMNDEKKVRITILNGVRCQL